MDSRPGADTAAEEPAVALNVTTAGAWALWMACTQIIAMAIFFTARSLVFVLNFWLDISGQAKALWLVLK
jgi:hypothetical protein